MDTNSTLTNGLRLLSLVNAADGTLGVNDLARSLGLAPSQVHRLLQTLVATGFCVRDPDTRRYRAGLRTLCLAQTFLEHSAIRRLVLPALHELTLATGCDTCCAVPDGNDAVVLATAWPGGRRTSLEASLGRRFGADTATYQVLAAHGIVSPANPGSTVIDSREAIRAQGYACKQRGDGPGPDVVAAPIRNAAQSVVAVIAAITCEPGMITEARLATAVMRCARTLVLPTGT